MQWVSHQRRMRPSEEKGLFRTAVTRDYRAKVSFEMFRSSPGKLAVLNRRRCAFDSVTASNKYDPSASRGSLASVPAAITAAGLLESCFRLRVRIRWRTEWTGVLRPPTQGIKAIRKPNRPKISANVDDM